MGRRPWRLPLALARVLAGCLLLSGLLGDWPPSPAVAAVINPFTPRFTTSERGDIAIVGNTLLTCPSSASTCAAAQNRTATGQQLDNNAYAMVAVDVDGDPTTSNSSVATLALPAGASVLWAGLYWGARSTAAARTSVQLRPPGAVAYQTVSGTLIGAFGNQGYYEAFADVTAQARAAGGGAYTVANVQAQGGDNRYAGWALVVVVGDPAEPLRQLTVFDGFARMANSNQDRTVDVPLAGLKTPPVGPVSVRLGVVGYEGDANQMGDTVQLSSGASGSFTTLSSAVNPVGNFFNGAIGRLGANLTAKNPNYPNQLGFDIAVVDANSILANGATSAVARFTDENTFHFAGLITTAIEIGEPAVVLTKAVTDLNGGPVRPGDTLEYTIIAANVGRDTATLSQTLDPIPAGTSYEPNSIVILSGPNAGPKTDATGDDQANFNLADNLVNVRLGAGASATQGGSIAAAGLADSSTAFRFRVRIPPDAADGLTIANQVSITY